jgi:hypothetical protein
MAGVLTKTRTKVETKAEPKVIVTKALASWLQFAVNKRHGQGWPITGKWIYRKFHYWFHTDKKTASMGGYFDNEMAEEIARLAQINYDRTKLIAIILSAYRDGEE